MRRLYKAAQAACLILAALSAFVVMGDDLMGQMSESMFYGTKIVAMSIFAAGVYLYRNIDKKLKQL